MEENINYAEWFERFWEQYRRNPYIAINNPRDRYTRVKRALSRCTCTEDIERYVCSLNSQKESTRIMMLKLFAYIKNNGGPAIESEVLSQPIYDSTLERRLEIAKYLHRPHNNTEIESHFRITERTRRKDIKALKDGIEAFGSTICLDITDNEYGQKECTTTVHPIFLPLNLTEVHALTVYLPKVLERYGVNRQIVMDIIERIKSQLSDYACEKLRIERPDDVSNDYYNDEMMAKQRKYVIDYLAKSGNSCRFTWKGEEYTGQIRHVSNGYAVCLRDGSILNIDPNEVDFTINLDYR